MTSRRFRLLATGTLVAAAFPAVACAPPEPQQAPHAVQPARAARPVTAVDNRALAAQEAERLLGLARLPVRAARVAHPPHGLAQPVSRSGSTSLVDDHAFWIVPLPFSAAVAWVRAHPPVGLAPADGGGIDTGPGLRVVGILYDDRGSAAWTQAQYEVGVSRITAGTSAVRVDGMADWLDPTPMSDGGPGRRVRLDVGGPCPVTVAGVVGVTSAAGAQGALLATRMVPTAEPTAARVCAYSGLNGHPEFALVREQLLGAAPARRIAAAAAAVPLTSDSGAVINCPADDGSVMVVALRYRGQPDVDLWVAATGCPSVANGRLEARASDLPSALAGVDAPGQ